MSSEWTQVQLRDLVEIKHGWPFKSEFFATDVGASSLPIVVAIGNFDYGGGFRFGSTRINRYTDDFPKDYRLAPGDILLVMTCQTAGGEILGIPGRIPSDGQTYLHNQRLGKVVIKHAEVSRDFLYWLFLHKDFNRHLVNSATGTKILHTAPTRIESFRFRLPPLSEQKRIAELLCSLDDRIALLREASVTLEAIAQALFKSWFVDFDPVRAKSQGLAPAGMDEATADLFPDSFEESALGMVPRGWQIKTLQDLLLLQRGFDLPAQDRVPGDFPIIAASGPSGTHAEAMAKGPGVVTGRSGVLGRVFLELDDHWPLNTTLWVKEFRGATACYAYEVLRLLDFKAFNAGSAVPTLNRNHIHGLPYVIPPVACVEAYEVLAIRLHQRARLNAQQAQTLATLRDTLLPRLISGQLRLPLAQEAIAEATHAD